MGVQRLETGRLVLEPLRSEHADELAPVFADASLYRFIGGEPPTAEELRARIARQAGGRSPDAAQRWCNWVVRERAGGEAVGTMQATVSGETDPIAELAWVIGAAHQGRGLATEAARLIIDWLRGQGVSRLWAHIHPGHDASMAVARSLGLRPTEVIVDGEVRWESPEAPPA